MPNPDDYIGFLISDVARLMRTAFDRRVRAIGLTRAQWLVLTRLHRRNGASQSELADMMEVERATAGRLIDRLEAKGWVERRAHSSDRRVNRIYLTAAADRLRKRMWKIAEQTVDHALAGLTRREADELSVLMAKVKAQLLTDNTPQQTNSTTSRLVGKRSMTPTRRLPTARKNGATTPEGRKL